MGENFQPRYCPWCGSDVAKWGHDDSCDRPESVRLSVGRVLAPATEVICGECGIELTRTQPGPGGGDLFERHECDLGDILDYVERRNGGYV